MAESVASPERAAQPTIVSPFQGWRKTFDTKPRALPWAGLFRPVGAGGIRRLSDLVSAESLICTEHWHAISMSWNEVVKRAQDYGVSETELMVLEMVRLHVPDVVQEMAGWVLKEFDHLDLNYDEIDMEVAIENCLERAWLRVLSRREVRRRPPEFSTYVRYFPSWEGMLDFTPTGHALAIQIFGEGYVRPGGPTYLRSKRRGGRSG